jgi:hypothetical protein
MREASSCSRFMLCSAVMKISVAKGSHCHDTMMMMENSGWSVSQSTGSMPKKIQTWASTP